MSPEKKRVLGELHRDLSCPMMGKDAWVAGNTDHGFHRLFKYLMFA